MRRIDCLRLAVLNDLEIFAREIADEPAIAVEDAHVHLDELDTGAELRLRRRRLLLTGDRDVTGDGEQRDEVTLTQPTHEPPAAGTSCGRPGRPFFPRLSGL